ncbi:MAG: LysR family transcriptional regulator [Simplicispira sp.]|nr:LysR family transcriptional regulator [Simplicispira sp.]
MQLTTVSWSRRIFIEANDIFRSSSIDFFDDWMPMTLKQLEAVYWVVRLGTFAKAADKLHTTQSTVSSRIQELETSLGTPLLDRGKHLSQPTAKGRELIDLAERMLGIAAQIRATVGDPRALSGVIRVGIAEFIAHAWLPEWVVAANERYPGVRLEMDVDLTRGLIEKLGSGQIDLALLPGPLKDPGVKQTSLGGVQFAWMASPTLGVPAGPIRGTDFQGFPVLLLSNKSNLHVILEAWFESNGVAIRRINRCNSLATLASLATAGLGIAYLPLENHRADLQSGRLQLVDAQPKIAPLEYVAAHRNGRVEPLIPLLAQLAVETSTFPRTESL